jgi:RND family efflux transporter MFP subunit
MTTSLLRTAAASGLVVLLAACSQGTPAAPEAATPVRVETARPGPGAPPITTNGVVASKDEMRLSFKVGGVIRTLDVQEGEAVERGQRLAEIELTEVNAGVEQASQLAAKAQRDLERGERLYRDEVITLEQLQDLRTQAAVAGAALRSAQFNRGYAVIEAPRDGVILRKLAEARELVAAGTPVLVLGARDSGYVVRAALADREIVQLALGDPAEIRMDAYPRRTFTGTVSEIAGAADERSGLFAVEVRIDAPPGPLASGLVAKLSLQPATGRAAPLVHVPVAAIVEGDRDRASVFVLAGGKAVRRDVRVAFIGAESIALADGLAAGETVITDGALYLEDGEPVTIVKDASQVVGAVGFRAAG